MPGEDATCSRAEMEMLRSAVAASTKIEISRRPRGGQ
jgi:hypothetical protein